jgi:hypothetical protein
MRYPLKQGSQMHSLGQPRLQHKCEIRRTLSYMSPTDLLQPRLTTFDEVDQVLGRRPSSVDGPAPSHAHKLGRHSDAAFENFSNRDQIPNESKLQHRNFSQGCQEPQLLHILQADAAWSGFNSALAPAVQVKWS